ncbi:MAG: tRNA (adenosine(37)-N6)-threonylcarbamoyltransferase complex transferase subunit TsaD [Oligoflexus sp.]
MRILGIESSCDETAAAVVESGQNVLSSVIASQIDVHRLFGGVVPEIAAREHLKVVAPIVEQALQEAGCTLAEIDGIAVTRGPGLIGALLVGISYAKGLAMAAEKPLIPVNHVHAHIHGAVLGLSQDFSALLPCLALVVSGGHTNLYVMKSPTEMELIGRSIDDACGESFDKVAKLFGLGYPGGPVVEKLAKQGDPSRFQMPRMVDDGRKLAFSYSGLKTHMVNLRHRLKANLQEQDLADLCAGFQEEALGQLIRKLKQAARQYPVKSLLIAGGVAANQRFREMVKAELGITAYFPHLRYCSDNAAMIAALGYYNFIDERETQQAFRNYDWDAFSRYQDV